MSDDTKRRILRAFDASTGVVLLHREDISEGMKTIQSMRSSPSDTGVAAAFAQAHSELEIAIARWYENELAPLSVSLAPAPGSVASKFIEGLNKLTINSLEA